MLDRLHVKLAELECVSMLKQNVMTFRKKKDVCTKCIAAEEAIW